MSTPKDKGVDFFSFETVEIFFEDHIRLGFTHPALFHQGNQERACLTEDLQLGGELFQLLLIDLRLNGRSCTNHSYTAVARCLNTGFSKGNDDPQNTPIRVLGRQQFLLYFSQGLG